MRDGHGKLSKHAAVKDSLGELQIRNFELRFSGSMSVKGGLPSELPFKLYLLPKLTGFPTWNDGESSSVSKDSLLKKLSRF